MYRPAGVTADGAAPPWKGKRLGRKKRAEGEDAGKSAWTPRPRRLQLAIEPKQVVACPAPFVALGVNVPPALLLGGTPGSPEEAMLTSATAATSASGVASWTNNALILTVTLHRSGVYEDDPFVSARCTLELREPVARGHLHASKQPDGTGPASPQAARAKPLCEYGLDLAEHCDPHSDTLQRELVLHPDGRDSRGAALTVVISSRHCEEVPVGELQRYREVARAGQAASAQVGELAEHVNMLMNSLETTHAKLLVAQDAEKQARQLAESYSADLEDMEDQLKVLEAERERLDAEYATLRALAALPSGSNELAGSSRVGVEPETFLAMQRDLVHTRRAVQRIEPQLQEARAQLRQLSLSSSEELPRILQQKVDALQRENDDLWSKAPEAGEEASLRQHILRLESDLQASDLELEDMELRLQKMREERDEAVSYTGRDLPRENADLHKRVEELQQSASEAASAATAREKDLSQQLNEARQHAEIAASTLQQQLDEARQSAARREASLEQAMLEAQKQAEKQREQEVAAVVSERDGFSAQCGELQRQLVDIREKSAAAAEAARAETEGIRAQATQHEAKIREEYTSQLGEAAAAYARELSSQETRLRQEAADQATESATSQAAAVAAAEAKASAELSELKGELLKEQQEVTVLTQDLQATKAQLDHVTVQLTELQATVTAQALPSLIETEGGASIETSRVVDNTSSAHVCREEGSSTTCVIQLRAEFASMGNAGSQAEFEMGFIEALTQVTVEQLLFRWICRHQHSSTEETSEQIQDQQWGRNHHDANEQTAALQGWLEVCHAQSYYDRLVAKGVDSLMAISDFAMRSEADIDELLTGIGMPTLQVRKFYTSCRELRAEMEHVRSRFHVHALVAQPASAACLQPVAFSISPAEALEKKLSANSSSNPREEGQTMCLQEATVSDIVACIQHFCRGCHVSAAGEGDPASLVVPALIKSAMELANAVAPDTELIILSEEQQPGQMAHEGELQVGQLRQENSDLRLQVQALEQEVVTLTEELVLAEDIALERQAAAEAGKSAISVAGSENDGGSAPTGTDAAGFSPTSSPMTQLQEQLRHAEALAMQERERCAELEMQCGELRGAKTRAEQALESLLQERESTVERAQGQELELDSLRVSAGELEQLRGQNVLLKRQLAAVRSTGNGSSEGSESDSADEESAKVIVLQDEVVQCRKTMATLEGETALLRQDKTSLQLQVESLKTEIATLTEEVEELENAATPEILGDNEAQGQLQVQAYLAEIVALTEEVEDAEEQLRKKDDELRLAHAVAAAGAERDADGLRQANLALEAQVEALKLEVLTLSAELEQAEAEAEAATGGAEYPT